MLVQLPACQDHPMPCGVNKEMDQFMMNLTYEAQVDDHKPVLKFQFYVAALALDIYV